MPILPTETELNFRLSKYVVPDEDQHEDVTPDGGDVTPVIPDTGGDDQPAADDPDTGLFTVSDTTNVQNTGADIAPIAFSLFAVLVILAFVLPKLVRKIRGKDAEYYDLGQKKFSGFRLFSTILASSSLLVGLVSVAFGYFRNLEPQAAPSLSASADIIGTDTPVYVKDTITIPASEKGYVLYIYANDERSGNKLAANYNYDITIDPIAQDGALTANSYGYTFTNPSTDATKFQAVDGEVKSPVLTFDKTETAAEKQIPIWYGVRAKDAEEALYQATIKYEVIELEDITLQEMTQDICAELEEGISYPFRDANEEEANYQVTRLKDGNCWTTKINDPDNPGSTTSADNWHDATDGNLQNLKDLYGITDETTQEEIDALGLSDIFTKDGEGHTVGTGNASVADFEETTVSFDVNNEDGTIVMPADITVNADDNTATVTMPAAPESHAEGQQFLGWGTTPDGSAPDPLYQPGDEVTLESPDVTIYAIWSQKSAKAILSTAGNLNLVYNYYTVDDYMTAGNPAHDNYKDNRTTSGTTEIDSVFEVPENSAVLQSFIPEKNRNYVYSSPDATKVAYINADESFKDFEPTSFKAWFRDFRYLEDVNLNNLNASQVTDTSYMFESQYQGTSPSVVIDWQNADFSNLKNANKMFGYFGYQAKDMTLNLQGWQIGEADLSNSFTRLGQFADGDIVVDLTDWDTSRVIGMSEMFTYLGGGKETQYNNPSTRSDSITIRGLSNWDVSNVKTIEKIFQGVGRNSDSQDDFELNMDASNWNLASVETMAYALSGIGQINYNHGNCTSFDTTNVDFSDWKIPADVDVSSLVYSTCANLSSMSSWDVSEMTNMDYMFNYQRFVNPPDLSNWDTSKVETMDHTFQVAKVNRSIESWDVSNAKIMSYTFNQTDMLQENVDTVMLDLSSWDVSNVEDMTGMFYYYRANSQNTFLNIDWKDKTSKVKNMSSMFDSTCRGALNCIIIGIEDLNVSGVETMRSMFRGTGGLSLDLSKWDVSHVSNMEGMFEEAGASAPSINLNLSGWDLASVTNAQRMFSYLSCSSTSGCYVGDMKSRVNLNLQNWKNINFSLHDFFKYAGGNASTTKIDVTGWDTSNVTEMGGMFNGAGAQSTAWPIIGVEDFDTSNVEDMASMFSWTGHAAPTPPSYSAKTLDLSRWNVNNVTAVAEMFNGVGGLNKIDLSNWFNGQTVNDLAIGGMFYGSSVETINLTGWGTLTNPKASGEIVTKSGIFQNASNLRNIYVTNGWSIPRVSTPYNNPDLNDNTFKDATSLPGYDATKVSYEYARIDTGDGGYFTDSCEYYGTCTQNSGNSINPAPISGNSVNPSYSPSYSPSIVEPTEPTSEPTTSTPKTTPSTNNPQSGNTEPLGVTRREQVDRTDYALIIVVSTSIALVIIGALAIFFIEKRDKDDEDEL